MPDKVENPFLNFMQSVGRMIDAPVVWVKKTIVEPNQKDYPWYHQKFRRVPTIDECYTDDVTCFYEADEQFKRDRKVDDEIVILLRHRFENCYHYEAEDGKTKCAELVADFDLAATNYFIKYGDLGCNFNVRQAYMKQKHRMVWERRHGPVGSGMKGMNEAEQ